MESHQSGPLEAELHQATSLLKDALVEACGTRVDQADTGQLARMEHVLMLAQDAARKAVSIRERKRRARRAAASAPLADAAPAPPDRGAHRSFVDASGITWDAFAVHPSAETTGKARLPEPFQSGWLSFDCGAERRRLSPIPADWLTVPEYALRELCRRAEAAPRRSTPPRNTGPSRKAEP
ncbi:MAG: hypothetical protein JWL60_1385 [Gemmatimonadetes bacterium]|jgi:hypothetical protein|nr:hypothetical protein [Gemmatimonadota bacterium]